jgi:hypothetical protein
LLLTVLNTKYICTIRKLSSLYPSHFLTYRYSRSTIGFFSPNRQFSFSFRFFIYYYFFNNDISLAPSYMPIFMSHLLPFLPMFVTMHLSFIIVILRCQNKTFTPKISFSYKKFEDIKGVIRIRISKKNRQHNGQKKKDKRANNDPQNITKDRVTRTHLKPGGELRCSGRVGSSFSTCDTRCVNLVKIPVISHERGKNREVLTSSGTYPWSFVTQIFHSGQPSHDDDRKTFEVMTST